ncbi:Movement protein P1 [Bienertia sinuspersici]
MWDRLKVRNRLFQLGLVENAGCPCCNMADETSQHLFFECNLSKHIWEEINKKLGIQNDCNLVSECYSEELFFRVSMQQHYIGSGDAEMSCLWNACIARPYQVVDRMFPDVYWRILNVMPVKVSQVDREWFRRMM